MHKYMEKKGEVTFDKIFNQRLGKYTDPHVYLSVNLCVSMHLVFDCR